ncbi:MAG: transporter substrate-binding domain-containing protein [Halopseudomonas aestusnigri]
MKHVFIASLSLGLLLSSPNVTLAEDTTEKSFVVCSEKQSYPPFGLGYGDTYPKENPGILVEILAMAGKQLSLKTQHIRRPWKRCMKLLEQNQVDSVFASIYLKERENIGRYPLKIESINSPAVPDPNRRLVRVSYSLFKKKDSPFNWNGYSFSNMTRSIGAPLGYVVVKKLREDHGIEATTVHTASKGFRHVADGHLDAYIIESNIGQNLISDLNLGNSLMEIKVPFAQYDWYLMISHGFYNKNPKVSEKLWDEIGEYREKNMPRLLDHYRNLP